VAEATVSFDDELVNGKTARTNASGLVSVPTERLADGAHVLHVRPKYSSTRPVGPAVAEDVNQDVDRIYRPLDVDVTIQKGRVQALSVSGPESMNGSVGGGTNPAIIRLQPVYFRSPYQNANFRKPADIDSIIVHHTSGSTDIGGTLDWFTGKRDDGGTSAHYVISAEDPSRIVKVVQDTGRAWQAGHDTWWAGETKVNNVSIGIEMSHKAGTSWPSQQIAALVDFLELLLSYYPSIKRDRIVGHMDVLTGADHVLTGRDCPVLEFDWAELERRRLGLVPNQGPIDASSIYGGFFSVAPAPNNTLRAGDSDAGRQWGGKSWPKPAATAPAPGLSVIGTPVQEVQGDLFAIGYSTNVDGAFTNKTAKAVQMFQQHFFAGSRRGSIKDAERGTVGVATAEFIKRLRLVGG
jgi:N-acetylmuramoyl-L-alanine amidase